ncbi:MAG: HEAT repeat domain-containing protein [FCB group bacterium]|jgi:HEAT repeat protein|nr:HEAT repeat domain-containing protein [FCB group bacterium]
MDEFAKALAGTDEAERLYAVQDMAETGNAVYAPLLVARLLVDESGLVRDAIVSGLKRLDCTAIFEPLFDLFLSPDAYMRNQAVVLFAAQNDDALGFLATRFDHADREVRKLILDALFEIGTRDAMLAIRAYIHDESLNVKITAIEYLGRLGDCESADDMLELFQREDDPMLRSTVLESLGSIASGAAVEWIVKTLAFDGDINRTPPLYLPQVLKLVAKVGDRAFIVDVLGSVENYSLYAEDLLKALDEGSRRFSDLAADPVLQKRLVAILKDKEVHCNVRGAVAERLARMAESGITSGDHLFELGMNLMARPELVVAGVRLLAVSAHPRAEGIIRTITERTQDDVLRALCEDAANVE